MMRCDVWPTGILVYFVFYRHKRKLIVYVYDLVGMWKLLTIIARSLGWLVRIAIHFSCSNAVERPSQVRLSIERLEGDFPN